MEHINQPTGGFQHPPGELEQKRFDVIQGRLDDRRLGLDFDQRLLDPKEVKDGANERDPGATVARAGGVTLPGDLRHILGLYPTRLVARQAAQDLGGAW